MVSSSSLAVAFVLATHVYRRRFEMYWMQMWYRSFVEMADEPTLYAWHQWQGILFCFFRNKSPALLAFRWKIPPDKMQDTTNMQSRSTSSPQWPFLKPVWLIRSLRTPLYVHHRVYVSPTMDPMSFDIWIHHSPRPYLYNPFWYYSSIYVRGSQLVLPFTFSDHNFLCVYHFSHATYKPRLFKVPWSDHPNHILWRVRIVKLLSV
jgi:hypothetical protein